MPLHFDPTRTALLRAGYARAIGERLDGLGVALRTLVDATDVFGLGDAPDATDAALGAYTADPLLGGFAANAGEWKWATRAGKVKAFRAWLSDMVKRRILSPVGGQAGKPWTAKFIESAYHKGVMRAYDQARKGQRFKDPQFYKGAVSEFLRAFDQPMRTESLEALFTRNFALLKGMTDDMEKQMSVELTTGLARGENNKKIAARLRKSVDLSKKRATLIARTEIVHAHAEGQLDSFTELNVYGVGVLAEWQTAGDDRVCPQCDEHNGNIYTIEEARGLIPLHPNCRCAWVPAEASQARSRKRLTRNFAL